MDDILNLFSMLSDKTRLRILLLLHKQELCVCEVYAALEMSQPRVSRQLGILKQARLIKDRREGKWVYYKLNENDYTRDFMRILSFLPDWLKNDPVYNHDQTRLQKMFDLKNELGHCECVIPGGQDVG